MFNITLVRLSHDVANVQLSQNHLPFPFKGVTSFKDDPLLISFCLIHEMMKVLYFNCEGL